MESTRKICCTVVCTFFRAAYTVKNYFCVYVNLHYVHIGIRDLNFSDKTMESRRISSPLEEILDLRTSLSMLFNTQRVPNPVDIVPHSFNNHIINIEDQSTNTSVHDVSLHDNRHHYQTTATDNFLNNFYEAANEVANEVVGENQNINSNNVVTYNNNNNNSTQEHSAESQQIKKYILFVCILLAKGLYDHTASILNLIVLLVTFSYTNGVVKGEIAKQNNKSWMSLLFITCYIIGCILFIYFEYNTQIFSPYIQHVTIWELLWSVLIIDFVLKLVTITFKIFLTCLPPKLLALQRRGKYFFIVEATSQLFRCIAPVQPWLYYFFGSYQGPQKILGVILCLLYSASKGTDLLTHIRLCQTAIWKLLQNVDLGASPSEEQLAATDGICPICRDKYSIPVRLRCKHIFCEICVLTWLNQERSCPLCRAAITDDPIYQNGHTSFFIQLY